MCVQLLVTRFLSPADAKSDSLTAPLLQNFSSAQASRARAACAAFLKRLVPSARILLSLEAYLQVPLLCHGSCQSQLYRHCQNMAQIMLIVQNVQLTLHYAPKSILHMWLILAL